MRHATSYCVRFLVLAALLTALVTAAPAQASESRQVFVHFFLVPLQLADGSPSKAKMEELEAWLVTTCGGFTKLGQAEGGWKNESGQVESDVNIAYLVSASRDRAREIAARLTGTFGVRVPYVLVFPGGLFLK